MADLMAKMADLLAKFRAWNAERLRPPDSDFVTRLRSEEVKASTFEEAKWVVIEITGGIRWVKSDLRAFNGDVALPVEPGFREQWDYDHRPNTGA